MAAIPRPSLVGRDRELGILRDHLTAARAGHGSLVLVGASPGFLGKTALAEALCNEAAEEGALVLVGHAYDLSECPPYGPWVEAFGRYRQQEEMPPLPDAFAQRGTVGAVGSQAALVQHVLDFFTSLAARRPVALLLEDLHWADPASLDLLRSLARALATVPLLLIATYRNDEVARQHPLYALLPLLVRQAGAERTDLRPLDDAAIRALIERRYHLRESDADRLAAYLRGRAEGNALFVGETLRSLEEGGALARDSDAWRLGDLSGTAVPPLLKQIIAGRVARLDMESQRLLAVAAVVGQDLAFTLFVAVAGADEDAVLETVEQASAAHLVVPTSDGVGFRFAHALIRETLYEEIVPLRRARLHRQIADALLALPQPDPDALVHHLRQARDPRLGHWLFEAGTRAFQAHALATATARYEEVLLLLTAPDDARRRYDALNRLVTMHLFQPTSVPYGEEAVRVAEGLGDAALAASAHAHLGLARAMNGDIATGLVARERALAALATHPGHLFHGFYQPVNAADMVRSTLANDFAAVGRLREARGLARAGAVVFNGYYGMGMCAGMLGEPEAARAALREYRATIPATQYRSIGTSLLIELLYAILPYHADESALVREVAAAAAAAYAQAGEAVLSFPPRLAQAGALLVHGEWEEMLAFLPLVRRRRHSILVATTAAPQYGLVVRARGERALGWEMVREMFPAGAGTDPGAFPYRYALGMQETAAALALDASDPMTAKSWLEAHHRWLDWSGAVLGLSEGQALWTQFYRQAGDADQAYACAQQALAHATAPRQPLALVTAQRLLGELNTDAGRFAEAATHLGESLVLADACLAIYERALTLLAQAELRIATDMHVDARTLLDEVRTICTPLGAKPVLARVETLTARLPTVAPAYPDGLTQREVDVLRLLAGGRTNQEMGDALFLSPRTIERHITSLYRKIDARGRADATTYALRHQLLTSG